MPDLKLAATWNDLESILAALATLGTTCVRLGAIGTSVPHASDVTGLDWELGHAIRRGADLKLGATCVRLRTCGTDLKLGALRQTWDRLGTDVGQTLERSPTWDRLEADVGPTCNLEQRASNMRPTGDRRETDWRQTSDSAMRACDRQAWNQLGIDLGQTSGQLGSTWNRLGTRSGPTWNRREAH